MTDGDKKQSTTQSSTDDFATSIVGAFAAPETSTTDAVPEVAGADAFDADALSSPVLVSDADLNLLPERLVLSGPVPGPKTPGACARFLLMLLADEGVQLRHWHDGWHVYRERHTGGRYAPLEGADARYAVTDCVRRILDDATYLVTTKDGQELRPWSPTVSSVREVVEAMASSQRLSDAVRAGSWIHEAARREAEMPGGEITCVANGLLWSPREGGAQARALLGHTPAFFTDTSVAIDYDAEAPAPAAWLAFLEQLWPGDSDSQSLLQEWFGYVLCGTTALHKILTLVGPPRCGKGTIAKILSALLGGPERVDHPAMNRLAEPFGLAPMLGKRLAVIGDARLGKTDAAIVEKLLMISGEDPVTVNRKNKDELNVRLDARIMIVSNEPPRLKDDSGALASRFLPLAIRVPGWLGREDLGLSDRLLGELPGILLWALEGADRLWSNGGRFTIGDAVRENMDETERATSPIKAFIADCFEICEDPAQALEADGRTYRDEWCVTKDALHEALVLWCAENGYSYVLPKPQLCNAVYNAYPSVDKARQRRGDKRIQVLVGLRARPSGSY